MFYDEHLPKAHLLVSITNRSLRWPCFRPSAIALPEFAGRPDDKTHTITQ